MKKLFFLAALLLSLAFLVSMGLSVGFLAGLDRVWSVQQADPPSSVTVSVLLPSERDPFWESLLTALRQEPAVRKVSFEVSRYNPAGSNAQDVLEKASLSRPSAILCLPPDSEDLTEVVNASEGRGIPVLLLENDLPNSRRRVYLGTSPFQLGHEAGRLLLLQVPGAQRGGVVLSQSSLDRQTVRSSLFLNGLNEELSSSGREWEWGAVISPPGRFAGEELVWGLLRRTPPVQVLVTTNPKDTSGALQTIVEANRVGKTKLVGVGEDAGLVAALEEGMVAGLLSRDPAEWSRMISTTLDAVLAGKPTSSYVNLPVHARTASGGLNAP